ncbi:hypothetical protein HJ025_19045 [Vibrio parahaemolyticus]|nr:hypothetical protein [Vibrio parahaemolyticus]
MASLSLTSSQVRKIEKMLNIWSQKLTWADLVRKIKDDLNIKISRQTLYTYGSIKQAFHDAKQRLRGAPNNTQYEPQLPLEAVDLLNKINNLENEVKGLRTQNQRLQGLLNDIRMEAENSPLLMELLVSVKRQHQS